MPKTNSFKEFNLLVGARISQCIEQAGFPTVADFAQHCGVPKSTMSEILSAKKGARLATFAKIAAGLGISVSELADAPELSAWVASHTKKKTKKTK